MFHLTTLVTVFAVIFVAELPDKSLFASLVLGTRHKALWVWLGVSGAFVVHVAIAVLAGGVLTLLPHAVVEAVVAVLFALGAVLLLKPEQDEEESEEIIGPRQRSPRQIMATSFAVVFIAEWGDVTQLAIANLTARYADPVAVALGAGLGLITVAGVAVFGGSRLLEKVPLRLVRRLAGVVLASFALLSLAHLLS